MGASLSAVEKKKSEDADCPGQHEQKRPGNELVPKQSNSPALAAFLSFEDKFQSLVPCLSRSKRLLAAPTFRIETAVSILL